MPLYIWHNVPMATPAKSLPTTPLLAALHLNLETVESGVPLSTLTGFAESSGLPLKDLYDIVIPARTLKHRRARREPLSRDESDKLARLVRTFDLAVRVFAGAARARIWLEEPKKRFAGRTPLDMLRTEVGGRQVEEFLIQIDEGMFA
jgi:putative toxin-antitoxin system antitoxin component (TIGR02293 family)